MFSRYVLTTFGGPRGNKLEVNLTHAAGNLQNNLVSNSQSLDIQNNKKPFHFIGIGGIGMSALARILLARGLKVSGSDRAGSEILDELKDMGASIHVGHKNSNVNGAGVVVVSTAITDDNPELVEAKKNNLPILHRSQLLAHLTEGKRLIGVSGTHGKTTTTGMLAQVLVDGDLDPTVVVGGLFTKIGANSRFGKSEFFVAEIDESDGTHVSVHPSVGIITNIETDHLENYPGGLEEILESMTIFAKQTKDILIVCVDDNGCRKLLDILPENLSAKVITYATKDSGFKADYYFESISSFGFNVYKEANLLGKSSLSVPGIHNKSNAIASVITALELGIPFETISKSLTQFSGVDRRFQILGEEADVTVIDDYAHHPTEVVATLQAAKDYVLESKEDRRIVILFQPHQPGRMKNHWNEFLQAFDNADLVLITDIYIARGSAIEGVNSEKFVSELSHSNSHYIGCDVKELATKVMPYLQSNDILMTVGAGSITKVGPQLLELLKQNGRSA